MRVSFNHPAPGTQPKPQHPVPSNKSQITSYPLILSRLQGEILKIPRSQFQAPSPRNGNGAFGKSWTSECVLFSFIVLSGEAYGEIT